MSYDKASLTPYLEAKLTSRLVPLHRWNAKDQFGNERGKTPRDGNWVNRDYTGEDIMAAVEEGRNIGFRPTADEMIVDMDPRNMNGVTCEAAVASLDAEFGLDLANAPTVRTGGGGLHIYCLIPSEFAGRKFRNEIEGYEGVEFKALGRQVVAAGSKHPNGNRYEWLATLSVGRPVLTEAFLNTALRETKTASTDEVRNISPETLAEYLEVIPVEEYDNNEDWVQLAMSCYHATNGEGIEEFLAWSTSDPNYANDEEMIRLRWDSFGGGEGITAATLMGAVAKAGHGNLLKDEPDAAFELAPLSSQDNDLVARVQEADNAGLFDRTRDGSVKRTVSNVVRALDDMGLTPVRNELRDEITIEGDVSSLLEVHPSMKQAFDDSLMHAVVMTMVNRYQFEPTLQQVHQALTTVALRNSFHPIRQYLEGLEWDGVDRVGTYLTDFAGATQNAYTSAVGENLLKAAVARVYQPGIKFDTMPILEGRQGCGKSTLLKVLGGEWTLEGLPNKSDLNHKDVIQALQGFWLVEVEEMAVMKKSDVDSLKAFLTRQTDKARFAYAREAKEYPRQCVFVGTTNDSEYLLDSTGNRRFLPVEVDVVDLNGLQAVRDQLWAQAVQIWKTNPTEKAIMLPETLWKEAAQEAEARRVADPVEYRLTEFLGNMIEDFVSPEQLLWEVLAKSPADADMRDSRRVSRAMMTMEGWHVCRRVGKDGKRMKGWERRPTE